MMMMIVDLSLLLFFSFLSLHIDTSTLRMAPPHLRTLHNSTIDREMDTSLHTIHWEGREKNEEEILMLSCISLITSRKKWCYHSDIYSHKKWEWSEVSRKRVRSHSLIYSSFVEWTRCPLGRRSSQNKKKRGHLVSHKWRKQNNKTKYNQSWRNEWEREREKESGVLI